MSSREQNSGSAQPAASSSLASAASGKGSLLLVA